MKQVAIIGLGQLGSRHLQALADVSEPLAIELVDISDESLELAVTRFYEIPNSANFTGTISKFNSVTQLSQNLELVIIASNSKERRGITELLLNTKKVVYLILEKVLFPALEDYAVIDELITSKGVKAWVNCSRRMMPSYQNIKQLITPNVNVDFNISASKWGMGSNGIHFIDLFCFLTNDYSLALNYDLLDDSNPIESTRRGYIDFTGTYTGTTNSNNFFKMTSYSDGSLPVQIVINTPFERITINEYLNSANYASAKNGWTAEDVNFEILYQSRLTTILANKLFSEGKCDLPSFKESTQAHILFLKSLINYQKEKLGKDLQSCQIS